MTFRRITNFWLAISLLLITATAQAQNSATPRQRSPLDATSWGVVYDAPATRHVKVRNEVPYLGALAIDIYSPPDLKAGEKRPAVVFINAVGDREDNKVKSWAIYQSWPRLVAAHGMIGISMDADGARVQESLRGVAYFNLACGHTRLGQKDKALEALTSAVAEGFINRNAFETDEDLAPLRAEPRFQELLGRLPKP